MSVRIAPSALAADLGRLREQIAEIERGGAVDLIVSRGPAEIRIPDLVGLPQEQARERLESVGLRLGTITTRSGRRGPPGVVVEQRPAGGTLAPHEGRVSLVISN